MRISRESYFLAAICLADLASTIYLVDYKSACEGNPLMSYYLQQGTGMFIAMKMVLCLLPIFIVEYARRYRPRLVIFSLRAVISGYLLAYLGGIIILNSDILQEVTGTKQQQVSEAVRNNSLIKLVRLTSNKDSPDAVTK